ncbi:copper resistance protein B [Altererythrobacter sp. SALINAS58]|nr:copper resistance protein B [Alteripontixanthobacter muriae]NTZ41720.1 copper resistance protein B [Alteripontixanthobacter muriae]
MMGAATPAMAQHAEHTMPADEQPATSAEAPHQEHESHTLADHANHSETHHDQAAVEAAPKPVDHSQMDHSQMGYSRMGHRPHHTQPSLEPSSPLRGVGPARAADAIWGAEAMQASREALARDHGAMTMFWLQGDRVEYRARQGRDGYLWDVQGYYGSDLDKLWFKSEGEGAFGEEIESAEVQALWSHAISPWFDLQTGLRQDLAPIDRTYAVIGVQGLAPYLFELDAAAFLSGRGDLTGRVEAELDQRITQRLSLQPRAELELAAQDVPELGIGAGLDSAELGLRLRYEIAREFAPYVGVEQEWKLGRSADYARQEGEDRSVTSMVVGVRFWF